MVKLIVLLLLFLSCYNVQAGWFLGLGIGQVTFDDSMDEESQTNSFVRGGYAFNEHLDIGLDLNQSLGSTKDDDDFVIDITYFYVRAKLPIYSESKLYFLAGVTDVELQNYSLPGFPLAPVELKGQSGEGYGLGLEIPFAEQNFYFSFEYVIYLDDDEFDGESVDVTVEAINFGLVYYY